MFFETAVLNKLCQCVLLKVGNGAGIKRQLAVKFLCQCLRQHHIADPYRGGKCFRKRIHIDDLVRYIDALQRWKRLSAETQLTVVIVLNDIVMIRFCRPAEQFITAADRHDCPGWKVMGRGCMNNINRSFFQLLHRNTVLIERHWLVPYLHTLINPRNFVISGILYSINKIVSEKLNQKVMQILRSCADNNLLRQHLHAAELTQIFCNRTAQL